jgi:hypothetical protein
VAEHLSRTSARQDKLSIHLMFNEPKRLKGITSEITGLDEVGRANFGTSVRGVTGINWFHFENSEAAVNSSALKLFSEPKDYFNASFFFLTNATSTLFVKPKSIGAPSIRSKSTSSYAQRIDRSLNITRTGDVSTFDYRI